MAGKWVIGDIHGCCHTLRELMEKQIKPGNDDRIYFLGDYIDRGPRSKEVIDYIRRLKNDGLSIQTLMGNHEEEMLKAYNEALHPPKFSLFSQGGKKIQKAWYSYGGDITMRSFGTEAIKDIPVEYIEWTNALELYIEEENFLLAHAGFNFNKEDIFSDTHAMLWIRDFEVDLEKTRGKKVVHGHVPIALDLIEQFIQSDKYAFIDLDNGCVYPERVGMGNLVALDLTTMELKVQRNIDM